jgi:trimeric autotransporter adhesin
MKTSRIKFPRRVRIHGGECGAVARALHHEAKSFSLPAVEENVFFTTKERKQMSTKTTLKRIALVAVSALGFGVLSTAPSSAATGTFTTAASLSTSSMTVVATSSGVSQGGKFYVDLTSNGTLGDKYPGLFSNESISVTVTAPTGGAVGDIGLQALELSTNDNTSGVTSASDGFATRGFATAATGVINSSAFQIPNGSALSAYNSNNWTPDANSETGYNNRYWMHVYPVTDTPMTLGSTYTLTVRVHTADAASSVIVNTLSVKFVTSMADSGAALTLSSSGDVYTGEGLSVVTGRYVRATVTNGTTGGRLWKGCAAATFSTACAPALTAQWVPVSGTPSTTDTFYVRDNGVAAEDHLAVTNSTRTNNTTSTAAREFNNGSYGVTTISTSGGSATAIAQAAAADTVLRVSITGASTSARATAAIIIRDTTTARDINTDLSMSATGSVAYNTSSGISTATAGDVARSNVESSTTWVLPLTTTSGTLTINVDNVSDAAVSGAVIKVTPTWSNSYVSTAVSPATSTSGTSYTTDASGNVSIAFSNSTPVDGGTLTLSITGFASGAGTVGTGSRTVVIVWQKPVVTTLTVLDPNTGVYVKTGSTTTFTVEVDDQFGNGMAGEVLQPSISDSSAANYVLNKTYATITTGATGTATWSLTDAAAEDEDYDTVVFTSITNTAKTASATITYAATLPVPSTVNLYYDADVADTANTLAGTTSIGTFSLQKARNQSRSLASFTDSATDDFISMRARVLTSASVAAEGAACTVTASSGAHLLGAANLPVSTRTLAVDSSGDVTWKALATTVGVKTYTVVCGSITKTITLVITNAAADARFITITGGATGTANGEGVPVTVKVTDRFGNGVGSVLLTLSASGAGAFSGGATTQSYTTDASGTYTFLATSLVEAGGAGTFTVSAASTAEFAAAAGKSANTAGTAYVTIDADVKAGNNSASHSITFASGKSASTVAAEAAQDAAAEAIDAANAATDAANLAAEAADAATVAAEEARDAADAATAAVEELATQVATLMAALKAQITTLANTVAKIAKKVKA